MMYSISSLDLFPPVSSLNGNPSGMIHTSKEMFLEHISYMIDNCAANGGMFFDIKVSSDASCLYVKDRKEQNV